MAKKASSSKTGPRPIQSAAQIDAQAKEQTGQQQVKIKIDDRDMSTRYANAFRTNATADEVMVDFGLNTVGQNTGGKQPEIEFQVNDRVIVNYYTAKRLAITLGQIVSNFEKQFGELKLNVADRKKG